MPHLIASPSQQFMNNAAILIHRFHHFPYRIRIAHGVIVHAGGALFLELFRLLDAPFDACLGARLGAFCGGDIFDEFFGQVDVEDAWDGIELVQFGQRLQARHDRHVDANSPAAIHEIEVFFVVEKHLGDDVVGACVYFGLGLQQVEVKVGRLEVFFGITGHADAEIRPDAVLDIDIQVFPFVHVHDLFDQVDGVVVAVFFGDEFAFKLPRIAPDREHIIDVEEIEVDQRIFGILSGEAAADEVWHSVDTIAVHDGGADPHRTGPFPYGHFLVITAVPLFINELFPVIRHVNKRRFELHEGVEGIENGLHAASFEGRKHFKGYQGLPFGLFKIFGDFHSVWPLPAELL